MPIAKPVYPSDAADKFLLRLPDGMRNRLKEAAKAANRTLNAEIVARLEASFGRALPAEEEALELERREVEVRLETLGSHRSVLMMHIDMLARQVHDTRGTPESHKLKTKQTEAEGELEKLEDQRQKLLKEWQQADDLYQAVYRKRSEAMEDTIDRKLQPEYGALADLEEEAKVPAGMRHIKRNRKPAE